MYLSLLVPSTNRSHFARYVDSNLSAVEDWRLVLYQENATHLVFVQPEVVFSIRQTTALIRMHHAVADPRHMSDDLRPRVVQDLDVGDFDLWSFDLNPYRLLDSIEDVLSLLGGLGCYWALHSFKINNPVIDWADLSRSL